MQLKDKKKGGGNMIQFPKNFVWGAATAAYQVEGAAFEGGKGPSIWDEFSHIEGNISQNHNGDVSCDHYHQYKTDVQQMKALGLKSYRFSIAWARVMPTGRLPMNQEGLDFYSNLVDELIENGIEPIVTLYHWDLPQSLQLEGGWMNPNIVNDFRDYAKAMFHALGDRVKQWITLNEPWVVAYAGHYAGRHAPGLSDLKSAVTVSHHLILSHAMAVEQYRSMAFGGDIGITLNLYPIIAASDSKEDALSATFVDGYHNRWFLDPVLKGSYPKDILEIFKKNLGFEVSDEDMSIIKSAHCDFLGVNYYFRKVIKHSPIHEILNFEEVKPEGSYTDMGWEIYPEGLYKLLMRLKEDYDNPRMMITENGAAYGEDSVQEERLKDDLRIDFLKSHFIQAYRAIESGVRVEGYYVWSLFDNFEWAYGYTKRFGIIDINYDTLERSWKKSATWYQGVIADNGITPSVLTKSNL